MFECCIGGCGTSRCLILQAKYHNERGGDIAGGEMSLLNQTVIKEENNYNMILLNNVGHSDRPAPMRRSRRPLDPTREPVDYTDNGSVICELLHYVKQINEEMHSRHINHDVDDHYKSEWRMVALVLDRVLLILFFIITVFTSLVIFINVPYTSWWFRQVTEGRISYQTLTTQLYYRDIIFYAEFVGFNGA